jgi:hypothetical protein
VVTYLKKAWRLFFGPKVVLVAVKDDFPHHPFYTSVEGARNVVNDPEYRALMAVGALNMAPSAVKARRLAEIARQRNALKDELAKVIKAKKARAPIYAALRALSIEELKVEGRR